MQTDQKKTQPIDLLNTMLPYPNFILISHLLDNVREVKVGNENENTITCYLPQ